MSGNPLRVVVGVTQFVAVSAALAFTVLLFVNEPDRSLPAAGGTQSPEVTDADDAGEPAGDGAGQPDGAAVFADSCARCHGPDAGGGVGPQLSEGRAVAQFPDIEDQIAVVTDGQGGMPAFGGGLTAEEIRAVVEYTRTL